MREFLIHNSPLFTKTSEFITAITFDKLQKFHWRGLIQNNKIKNYKEHFVLINTDYRIILIIKSTLKYCECGLENIAVR